MTTLTVPQMMLREIIANPTDVALRSIYADYLEEYGNRQERHHAELIRYDKPVRLVVASEGRSDWAFHRVEFGGILRMHSDHARKFNIARTLLRSSGLPPQIADEVEYRHGFIEVIKAPFEVLCKNLKQWVTEHPLMDVEVSGKQPWFTESDDGTDREWSWWNRGNPHYGVINHLSVFNNLWVLSKIEQRKKDDNCRWIEYDTEEEANKALSDTLLDMARRGVL